MSDWYTGAEQPEVFRQAMPACIQAAAGTRTGPDPVWTCSILLWAEAGTCRLAIFPWTNHSWHMEKVNDIRHGRHCVFLLRVCRDFEAEPVEFDGEDDHVHLLVVHPPKAAISPLVSRSERRIRQTHPQEGLSFNPQKLRGGSLRPPSYFAGSCGGAPLSILRQHIE